MTTSFYTLLLIQSHIPEFLTLNMGEKKTSGSKRGTLFSIKDTNYIEKKCQLWTLNTFSSRGNNLKQFTYLFKNEREQLQKPFNKNKDMDNQKQRRQQKTVYTSNTHTRLEQIIA